MAEQITPRRGLTFDDVWAVIMELRETQKETDRLIKETAQQMKETDRKMQETDRRLGNSFGELAEHLVLPNILEKFQARGYVFTKAGSDIQFKDRSGKTIAEVDIWLENGDSVLAIEVKARLREKDVEDHIRRMGVLRGYFDDHQDKRKLLGALAGAVMMEED
jgi:predicted AAA+ superfamily ATPase